MSATININLKVPFNEKDQAKSLGARWNAETKLWYVPVGVEIAPFNKWMSSAPNIALTQTIAETMAQAMAQAKADINISLDDEMDDINARLRAAYELNEDAF